MELLIWFVFLYDLVFFLVVVVMVELLVVVFYVIRCLNVFVGEVVLVIGVGMIGGFCGLGFLYFYEG